VVLLDLGRAELAAGQTAAAVEHLEASWRSADDRMVRARALVPLLQAMSAQAVADFDLSLPSVAAAIEDIRDRDRELWLRLQAQLIVAGGPTRQVAESQLEELSRLTGATPGEAAVLAHLIFRRLKSGASANEIAELAERAARQADALAQDGTTASPFSAVILGLRWADRLDTAERVLERALVIARERGSVIDFANVLNLRAEVYMRRGMLREAEADARGSIGVGVEDSWHFARGVKPLLQSLVEQGRTNEAAETLAAEIGDVQLAEVPPMTGIVLVRAQVRAACGDHAGAIAEFDDAARRAAKWGGTSASQIGDILIAAQSHRAIGDPRTAESLLADAAALANQWDTPGALGQVMHAEALLNDDGDAAPRLREAVNLLGRSPARLELARAMVDLGAALRRAGHRTESRDPLRDGYELARTCGADGLAETARHELATSGVRIRRDRLSGVDSLTPSERRIADMAAEGLTNAAIAQGLFVTLKTVEMHLTHIYRKLDISGRIELARVIGEHTPRTR
jgi:DNA-binding CsgD family transcriptional regulator